VTSDMLSNMSLKSNQVFLRKVLSTRYGLVGTRFSILGTRIGSLKHLEKTWWSDHSYFGLGVTYQCDKKSSERDGPEFQFGLNADRNCLSLQSA